MLCNQKFGPSSLVNLKLGSPNYCSGSGKTTLISSLRRDLPHHNHRGLILNLDPAAVVLPLECSYDTMDIRNIVQYKEVLEHFNLGHNAGILLSLDLVAFAFDKVKTYLLYCTCRESRSVSSMHGCMITNWRTHAVLNWFIKFSFIF